MSYLQVCKAATIAREIEWDEWQREYINKKVQSDFNELMERLNNTKGGIMIRNDSLLTNKSNDNPLLLNTPDL